MTRALVSTFDIEARIPAGALDRVVAGLLVGALGAGAVSALAGMASDNLLLLFGGGGAAAAATLALGVAGWIDFWPLLIVALPLPALVSGGDARLAPAAIVNALIVAGWLLCIPFRRERLQLGALSRTGVACFGIAVIISAGLAENRLAALREVVNLGSMMALLIIATHEISRGRLSRSGLARLIAVVAGLAGMAAAAQALGLIGGSFPMAQTGFYRATIGFGWPNESGMFFAVALPVGVLAFQTAHGPVARWVAFAAILGCGLGLLSTFSRGSWLAALLSPAVLLLAGGGRSVARIWLFAALGVLLLDVAAGGVFSNRAVSAVGDYAVEQRADLMLVGVLMFLDHPWTGVGPGGFGAGIEEYGPQILSLTDYVGSAHNGYIEIAAEAGMFGLLGFLIILIGAHVGAVRWVLAARGEVGNGHHEVGTRRTVLWALASVALVSMTIWPFAHGVGQLVVLVIAMAVARPTPQTFPSPAPPT